MCSPPLDLTWKRQNHPDSRNNSKQHHKNELINRTSESIITLLPKVLITYHKVLMLKCKHDTKLQKSKVCKVMKLMHMMLRHKQTVNNKISRMTWKPLGKKVRRYDRRKEFCQQRKAPCIRHYDDKYTCIGNWTVYNQ